MAAITHFVIGMLSRFRRLISMFPALILAPGIFRFIQHHIFFAPIRHTLEKPLR